MFNQCIQISYLLSLSTSFLFQDFYLAILPLNDFSGFLHYKSEYISEFRSSFVKSPKKHLLLWGNCPMLSVTLLQKVKKSNKNWESSIKRAENHSNLWLYLHSCCFYAFITGCTFMCTFSRRRSGFVWFL